MGSGRIRNVLTDTDLEFHYTDIIEPERHSGDQLGITRPRVQTTVACYAKPSDEDKDCDQGKTHCIFINLTYVKTSSLTV